MKSFTEVKPEAQPRKITWGQYRILEAVAFWRAEISYTVERFGNDDSDLPKYRESLEYCLNDADKAKIPWSVQNNVLIHAENWRNHAARYLSCVLKEKGVIIE